MTSHAAIHTKLEQLEHTCTIYCDTLHHYADIKSLFRQLNIQYDEITCRLHSGNTAPGFRISTEAFIFMATLQLMNSN